jgi:hypothetical protein
MMITANERSALDWHGFLGTEARVSCGVPALTLAGFGNADAARRYAKATEQAER